MNSSRPSSGDISPALRYHKQLADKAYKSISAGLDLEKYDSKTAIEHYKRGVLELQQALQIKFTNQVDRYFPRFILLVNNVISI